MDGQGRIWIGEARERLVLLNHHRYSSRCCSPSSLVASRVRGSLADGTRDIRVAGFGGGHGVRGR
jgi:hypothetical protein